MPASHRILSLGLLTLLVRFSHYTGPHRAQHNSIHKPLSLLLRLSSLTHYESTVVFFTNIDPKHSVESMSLLRWLTGSKPHVGLLLGTESTGKTSALYTLKLGKIATPTMPTIALNVEEIKRGSRGDFILWDIGGCDQMRALLRPHFSSDRFVLYFHDAERSGEWLDSSLAYFRQITTMMRQTGVTHMWILITKQDLIPTSERDLVVGKLRSLFEAEIFQQKDELTIHFIDAPGLSALDEQQMHDVLDQVQRSLGDYSKRGASNSETKSPETKDQDQNVLTERVRDMSANQSSPEVFWQDFQNANILSWNHYMHLRSGYFVLLDNAAGERNVLSAADIFLSHLARLRDSNPQRFRNTAHRTMTIFWLSMLNMSALSYEQLKGQTTTSRDDFTDILLSAPALMDTSLWSKHYSRDLMFSNEARKSWQWPDLLPLPASLVHSGIAAQPLSRESDVNECLTELALVVVQISMRCHGKRGALIKHTLGLLEPLTVRLRAKGHPVPPFSTTHVYFWVQLVHACLASIGSATAQALSTRTFMDYFSTTPQEWSRYYSSGVWNDISSRTEFACPDLTPLPNLIKPSRDELASNNRSIEIQTIELEEAMEMIAAAVTDYGARVCSINI